MYTLETRPKVCASIHVTTTEGFHFRQKKSVVDGVKGKVDDISNLGFVHHASPLFRRPAHWGVRETLYFTYNGSDLNNRY